MAHCHGTAPTWTETTPRLAPTTGQLENTSGDIVLKLADSSLIVISHRLTAITFKGATTLLLRAERQSQRGAAATCQGSRHATHLRNGPPG